MKRGYALSAVAALLLAVPINVAASGAPSRDTTGVEADRDYAGSEACKSCHEQRYAAFKNTTMGKIFFKAARTPLESKGCEACHGPSRPHVEFRKARAEAKAGNQPGQGGSNLGSGETNPGETATNAADADPVFRFGKKSHLPAEVQNDRCLECHEKGMRLFWKGSSHESRGVACATCHQVMQGHTESVRFQEPLGENRHFVKSTQAEVCFQCHPMRRAQLMRSSHMPFREGKVTCTNCHNPHGTPNPKLLVEATVNENCYKCHAERRGPFLWEHPPVLENCLNCHDAHGSSKPQLLKARAPRLCQQCHDAGDSSPTHNGSAFAAVGKASHFAFNRGCTNCHIQIHGSNNPSGVRFQR